MQKLPADEETVASWIFDSMQSMSGSNGITLARESFEKVVRALQTSKRQVFYLHEDGKDLEALTDRGFTGIGFILGDQAGLDPASEKLLDSLHVPRVSIGPRSYLSSSCIIFVNSWLDSLEG